MGVEMSCVMGYMCVVRGRLLWCQTDIQRVVIGIRGCGVRFGRMSVDGMVIGMGMITQNVMIVIMEDVESGVRVIGVWSWKHVM